MEHVEDEISRWRELITQGPSLDGRDIDELESHLRDQIADLQEAGLDEDEAFLIAMKRVGRVDDLSREFAQEQGGRLWRQLSLTGSDELIPGDANWLDAVLFALAAAVTTQVARLAAGFPASQPGWLFRNAALFVIPFAAAYFLIRRRKGGWAVTGGAVVALAIVANVYPFAPGGDTTLLVAVHLPVVLWFLMAYPYTGGAIGSHERRMDFVRFTGEWFIYYVLIALGGGVLVGLTMLLLEPTGVEVDLVAEWVLPSGAAGAVVIAAWLVESKQRVVENMAPVLTMVFTPLFAVVLLVATVVYGATGFSGAFDRELVGVFDALLIVVVGLILYGISARDTAKPVSWMDRIQLVTVVSALALDAVVLAAMVSRIGELGFTPNRAAVVGLNVVLLIGLAGTAWHLARFVAGRSSFHRLERWQTAYLPAYPIWAAFVVAMLPPLFSFN